MLGIINYFTGWHDVTIPAVSKETVLTFMLCGDYVYWNMRNNDDGSISFRLLHCDTDKFTETCKKNSVDVKIEPLRGFPRLIIKYKKRVGLLIGILMFVFLVQVSSLFIWEVSVSGNEKVTDDEIIELLNELGCGVGSYIPSINFDRVHNAFLMKSENIAWISVNLRGTVANVEVREIMFGQNSDDKDSVTYSNIVASEDGQIELIDTYQGRAVVNIGDSVQKGDLLISGVLDNQTIGLRYKSADGKVFARVNKKIVVEIPKKYTQKVYTGKSKTLTSVKIFGKSINLFINSGNLSATCDKIIREEKLNFFGTISVPVVIVSETYNEYEEKTVILDENEIVDRALKELRVKTDEALENAELLERTINSFYDGEVYRIECLLYCLEDIAVSKPFEVSENSASDTAEQ